MKMCGRMYVKETAKALGIGEYTLRMMAKQGRIPCWKSGNRYIFDVKQCDEFLKSKAMENVKKEDDTNRYGTLRRTEV
jgi:excisionase family DNA binding protein